MPRFPLTIVSLTLLIFVPTASAQLGYPTQHVKPVIHPTCTAVTTSGCRCFGVGQCTSNGHVAVCDNGNQVNVCVEDHNGGCDCETYEQSTSTESQGARAAQGADF